MENKAKRISLVIFFSLFAFICSLHAQNASSKKFEQKLQWKEDDYSVEYEVEIKSLTSSDSYVFKTDKSSIKFSIPSGDYQWRITGIDVLGRR
ncbi:MAG: hypothetical protein K5839_04525, partial [Treponemataceae bacterium]|nr:hypothetical protein [Treponemataceae bacterium]